MASASLEEPDMTYTKELRKATRDVHKLTDMLINAKFAFALTDETVWADGLLAFHEIYKFLEQNLPENLLPVELHRSQAFEKDLEFFLGKDWKKTYEPRESVKVYLKHMEEVRDKNIILLFAYAFQMYMALMSGGQLLQKKRMIKRQLWIGAITAEDKAPQSFEITDDMESRPMPAQVTICPPGCSATYFEQDIKILKGKLRNILNDHYPKFDDEMRADFINETRNVFTYNSEVVRSIKGVNWATFRTLGMIGLFVLGAVITAKLIKF